MLLPHRAICHLAELNEQTIVALGMRWPRHSSGLLDNTEWFVELGVFLLAY